LYDLSEIQRSVGICQLERIGDHGFVNGGLTRCNLLSTQDLPHNLRHHHRRNMPPKAGMNALPECECITHISRWIEAIWLIKTCGIKHRRMGHREDRCPLWHDARFRRTT